MAPLAPFRFEWAQGPLHRLHPLAKLSALLLGSWLALTARAPMLPPPFALAAAALGLLRVGLADLARNARFLIPFAIFVLFVNLVAPESGAWLSLEGLFAAALYMLRLSLVFLLAELFYRSTSTADLADAATRLARRLPLASRSDPGFYLSLALGFIPRSLEAYERCREAALARGLRLGAGGGRAAWKARLLVLESFVASALRSALRSAEALEARCYTPSRSVEPRPLRAADILLPLSAAAITYVCLRY